MRFILILLVALFAYATEIKGAFGINLGEKANLDNLEVLTIKNDNLKVIPPKKVSLFDNYYVKITPISKLIYEIKAYKIFEDSDKCHQKLKELKAILENKYGEFKSDIFSITPLYKYENQNREISIECNDNEIDRAILSITYLDKNLEEKAKEEKIVQKSKSIQEAL